METVETVYASELSMNISPDSQRYQSKKQSSKKKDFSDYVDNEQLVKEFEVSKSNAKEKPKAKVIKDWHVDKERKLESKYDTKRDSRKQTTASRITMNKNKYKVSNEKHVGKRIDCGTM